MPRRTWRVGGAPPSPSSSGSLAKTLRSTPAFNPGLVPLTAGATRTSMSLFRPSRLSKCFGADSKISLWAYQTDEKNCKTTNKEIRWTGQSIRGSHNHDAAADACVQVQREQGDGLPNLLCHSSSPTLRLLTESFTNCCLLIRQRRERFMSLIEGKYSSEILPNPWCTAHKVSN